MGKNKKDDKTQLFDMKIEDDEESLDFDLDQLAFEREMAGTKPAKKPKDPAPQEKTEKTVRLVDQPAISDPNDKPVFGSPPPFSEAKTQTKVSYGAPASQRPQNPFPERVMTSAEATLKQSEHLRIAQNHLTRVFLRNNSR